MSISSSHSRPNFDLEGHPRLHHSPSLPNIWFPPHAGPIPQDIIATTAKELVRPPTPPVQTREMSSSPPASSVAKAILAEAQKHRLAIENNSHASGQAFRPTRGNRKDRAMYITPPLTPSSSIKTTTSTESAESHDTPHSEEDYFNDSDKESTRLIMVGDLNPQIPKDLVEAALIEALSNDSARVSKTRLTDSPNQNKVNATVKSIDVNSLQSSGDVFITFYDLRHSRLALQSLSKPTSGRLSECVNNGSENSGSWLSCRYATIEDVSKKVRDPLLSDAMDGGFYVSVTVKNHQSWCDGGSSQDVNGTRRSAAPNTRVLKNYLKSFGDLLSFTFVRDEESAESLSHGSNFRRRRNPILCSKTFHVEYYDLREADAAYQSLDNQVVFGMKFAVYGRSISANAPTKALHTPRSFLDNRPVIPYPPASEAVTIYSSRQQQGFTLPPPIPTPPAFSSYEAMGAPQWENESYTGHKISCATPDRKCDYCPSRGPPISQIPYHIAPTPSPPIMMCSPPISSPPPIMPHMMMSPPLLPPQPAGVEFNYQQPMFNFSQWAFEQSMSNRGIPVSTSPPLMPFSPPLPFWIPEESVCATHFNQALTGPGCSTPTPGSPAVTVRQPPCFQQAPSSPTSNEIMSYAPAQRPPSPSIHEEFERLSLHNCLHVYSAPAENLTKNQLNISKIEEGQDVRTTVMIKNIPNKMSDTDLILYINKVCPRKIDFLYLRMDFKNGCNVGYAFVNFITTQDLFRFAKAKLGEKWNMFSSEKVLQMSYANYQGKEALVEKFKNSCIMDERESWRPKIFYSSGPQQGLPEPFPAPTHNRRKERSYMNRGDLFVPGIHHRNPLNSPLSTRADDRQESSGRRGGLRRSNPRNFNSGT